jgi:hypothetical protein
VVPGCWLDVARGATDSGCQTAVGTEDAAGSGSFRGTGLCSIGWVALGFSMENLAEGKLAGECCYPMPVPGASSS